MKKHQLDKLSGLPLLSSYPASKMYITPFQEGDFILISKSRDPQIGIYLKSIYRKEEGIYMHVSTYWICKGLNVPSIKKQMELWNENKISANVFTTRFFKNEKNLRIKAYLLQELLD
jgi:hypothetical protein